MINKLINIIRSIYCAYVIRPINQICCFDFPSENNGWHKYGSTPVYGNLSTDSVFDPYVFECNGKLVMIVSERLHNGIDMLESVDGIHWLKTGTILQCVHGTWQNFVNRASVVYHDGVWHIWYTGQYNNISMIGHSSSEHGVYFRNADKPCIAADLKSEGVSVMNPCVIWNEHIQKYQMWYSAGENYEPDAIFYAESKDGDNWIKREEPVLSKLKEHPWECKKIGGCDVVRLSDGSYIMYYIGYQNVDVARICYATSKDGVNWIRDKMNLLIAPSKGTFDSDSTYKPAVLYKDDIVYMWYNGRHGNHEYIGLATKHIK